MPGFNISFNDSKSPRANVELARIYRWRLNRIVTTDETQNLDFFGKEELKVYLSLDIPAIQIETKNVMGMNISYNFVKSVKFDPINIVFYDAYDKSTTQYYLEKFIDRIWNPYGGFDGFKRCKGGKYKCEIHVDELNCDGDVIAEFVLYNAFPTALKPGKFDMGNSALKQLSMTFSYDYYTYNVLSQPFSFEGRPSHSGEANTEALDRATSSMSRINPSTRGNEISTGIRPVTGGGQFELNDPNPSLDLSILPQ